MLARYVVFFLTLIDPCARSQDAQIEKEKQVYSVTGGCTALAVVYLLGKLYVANAGDSRCVGVGGLRTD